MKNTLNELKESYKSGLSALANKARSLGVDVDVNVFENGEYAQADDRGNYSAEAKEEVFIMFDDLRITASGEEMKIVRRTYTDAGWDDEQI